MRFVETPVFTRALLNLLSDDEYRSLQLALMLRPDAGDLIPGSGGLRKFRWSLAGKGKRGGTETDLLLAARRRGDLHAFHLRQKPPRRSHAGAIKDFKQARQGEFKMNKTDFVKLVASVKQAGKIRRGEMKASRIFNLKPVDVRAIRNKLGLSQADFATMIGVSVATLQNWEQGRRRPEGPAQALLKVAAANPQAVVDALAR
jgi:putative transcriptional regulator